MQRTVKLLLALLMSASSGLDARAAPPTAVSQLETNARYWAARGRQDKAAKAWQRLLRVQPNHQTALAELALWFARADALEAAESYLERLRRAHPKDPRIPSIQRMVALGKRYDALITAARKLVSQDRLEAAVARYREAFGSQTPRGRVALEFYQTLGGTEGGWSEARRGLERLAEANAAPIFALALAKHLTYREATRRQGIQMLAELATAPNVAKEAAAAEKQALLWTAPIAENRDLFRAYLERHPDARDVQQRLDTIKTDPLANAWRDLQAGDRVAAKQQFEAALEVSPDDTGALSGLGTVALQEHRFERAHELFERVRELAPDNPDLWQDALASAELWSLIERAKRHAAASETQSALELLARAREIPADQAHQAGLLMARIHTKAGAHADAQRILEEVLEAHPQHADALAALVRTLVKRGRAAEASRINERLAAVDPEAALDPGGLEARSLLARARRACSAGRAEMAVELLEDAALKAPDDALLLLEIAKILLELGELGQARAVVDRARRTQPQLTEARLADARLASEEGRPRRGLAVLEEIPPEDRSDAVRRVRQRLTLEAETRAALQAQTPATPQTLERLARRVDGSPELMPPVALAFSELGEHERAVELMRRASERVPAPPASMRLQLAAVLLRAGRMQQARAQIRQLRRQHTLSPRETAAFERLQIAYAVRYADALRQQGKLEQAWKVLQARLQQAPESINLLKSFGRLLLQMGESEDARSVFMRVLERAPGDSDARVGAVHACLAAGDGEAASRLVDQGLQSSPDAPRIHLLAGRLAARRGSDAEAVRAFQRARKLLDAQSAHSDSQGNDNSIWPLVQQAQATLQAERVDTTDPDAASLRAAIDRQLTRVRRRNSARVQPVLQFRYRAGVPGTIRLRETALQLTGRIPLSYYGHLELGARPVLLQSGELNLASAEDARWFGSGQTDADAGDHLVGARGVGLTLGYRWQGLHADVGVTPLGFARTNVVGGVRYAHEFGAFRLKVGLSRRLVTDSVLAYAGLRDPVSGEVWGGVLSHAGRLDLSYTAGELLFYSYGKGAWLVGKRVAENWMGEAGLGTWWRPELSSLGFALGFNSSVASYARNSFGFTLGHGGYFSPQLFLHAGIPVRIQGSSGGLRWRAEAEPGLNAFEVRQAALFPGQPELEDRSRGPRLPPTLANRSVVGFAFDGSVSVGYALTEQMDAELGASVHTARDYTEVMGSLQLHYTLFNGIGASERAGGASL